MKIIFIGGASMARLNYEIIRKGGHQVPVIYDRTPGLKPPWDCFLFDDENDIPRYARDCEGFLVCIGDSHGQARVRYSHLLHRLGLEPISAIHSTAFFGEGTRLGVGLHARPGCVVDDYVVIGDYCILNVNCTIAHESVLGAGVHVMTAAAIAGKVEIGDYSTIGTNATVLPRVRIGTNCLIGAGAVVTKDVPDNAIMIGAPAKVVRYQGAKSAD